MDGKEAWKRRAVWLLGVVAERRGRSQVGCYGVRGETGDLIWKREGRDDGDLQLTFLPPWPAWIEGSP